MYRLETTADFVLFAILSLALITLGALMLSFPLERLPEDRKSYRAVGGVLREVKDESGSRSTSVAFSLDGSSLRFVSRIPLTREAAKGWVVGQTQLQFFVLAHAVDGTQPVPVYGIKADSRELRTLEQDLAFTNARANPWGGLMALAIGLLGLSLIAFRWRRSTA